MTGVWSTAVRRRLSEQFSRFATRGTILHLHQWTRAFSPSVFAASLDSGLPFVVTAHDYFLACPNGVYFLFNRQEACSLTPLSPRCLAERCDPKSALIKGVRVLRSAATARAIRRRSFDVIHVSDRGLATLQPLLPPDLRHHRIDNPIEVPRGAPAEISPEAPFAFVGRLTREKGAVLAAAAARAASVPIAFVGEGPAADEIRMVNPDAQLLGWLHPEQLTARLRRSVRAVVAPSLWLETGPLTVAEAAACGVPAIVSARCGAAERVNSGETGFVVEPEEEALALAMRELSIKGRAQAFGAAAYEVFWADPPSAEAHARALIRLYETMEPQQTMREQSA